MSLFVALYVFALFFLLTPGILVSLPPKGSKMVVAAVHALVFAVIFYLTSKFVWRLGMRFSREGMEAGEEEDEEGEPKKKMVE